MDTGESAAVVFKIRLRKMSRRRERRGRAEDKDKILLVAGGGVSMGEKQRE